MRHTGMVCVFTPGHVVLFSFRGVDGDPFHPNLFQRDDRVPPIDPLLEGRWNETRRTNLLFPSKRQRLGNGGDTTGVDL